MSLDDAKKFTQKILLTPPCRSDILSYQRFPRAKRSAPPATAPVRYSLWQNIGSGSRHDGTPGPSRREPWRRKPSQERAGHWQRQIAPARLALFHTTKEV